MADTSRLPWTERLALPVQEVAELLTLHRRQVHRLIADWAFGDPAKLPTSGASKPHKRIPTDRVRAYLAGDREYPPGDPRGQATVAEQASA